MASSSASTSTYSNPPCAACKFLRRKCLPGCIFAPYFPPEDPTKFVNVHKIFGASNVSKLLNEVPPHQREDAVNSLAYESEARIKDPVYGCVRAISELQRQVLSLHKELEATNAELLRYANNEVVGTFNNNNYYGSGYVDPNAGGLLPYSNWTWNNIGGGGGDGSSS